MVDQSPNENAVFDLLARLIDEGAEVKDSKTSSSLSKDALREATPEQFEAWVTWTKSF